MFSCYFFLLHCVTFSCISSALFLGPQKFPGHSSICSLTKCSRWNYCLVGRGPTTHLSGYYPRACRCEEAIGTPLELPVERQIMFSTCQCLGTAVNPQLELGESLDLEPLCPLQGYQQGGMSTGTSTIDWSL